MKQLVLIAFISIVFGAISCNLIEETHEPDDFPSWIKNKIEELSAKSGQSCENIWVVVYEVQGKRYYNIDLVYSSCNSCNLYDKYGNWATTAVLTNFNQTNIVETRPGCSLPR